LEVRDEKETKMANQLVDVEVDSSGKTSVSSATVSISIKKQEQVVWKTDQNQPFAVCFEHGGPFADRIFVGTKNSPAQSGYAASAVANTDYKYVVRVLGAAELDPVVHTDP
jgi:hypothetical protein